MGDPRAMLLMGSKSTAFLVIGLLCAITFAAPVQDAEAANEDSLVSETTFTGKSRQEQKVAQKPRKEVKAPAKKALKQEKKVAQKPRKEVKKRTSTISNKKAEEVTPSGSGETVGQFVKQITSNWKASPSAVAKKSSAPQSAATNLMLTLVLVISTALYCN